MSRKDHRHNFSLYFYQIYLQFDSSLSMITALGSFVPQLGLVFFLGVRFSKNLAFACFLQTFAFIMLNKVVTSQYFMWYLGLLPLVLPHSNLTTSKYTVLCTAWVGSQALWLSQAYRLEFLGQNVFHNLWICSIAFYMVQTAIVCSFIAHNHS